jgi:inner membrane protein
LHFYFEIQSTFKMSGNNWITQSPTVKILFIAFLCLILMIPCFMISGIIQERQSKQYEVNQEIYRKYGSPQMISGAILSVPVRLKSNNTKKDSSWTKAFFLPEKLSIKGKLIPEVRYQGIYKSVVYHTDLVISGVFRKPKPELLGLTSDRINLDNIRFNIPITDLRGVRGLPDLAIGGAKPEVTPSSHFGVGVGASLTNIFQNAETIPFKYTLRINGSQKVAFMPYGKTTEVSLSSDWPSPKFTGNFLPQERTISDKGFTAKWNVLEVSRDIPAQFLDGQISPETLRPADPYAGVESPGSNYFGVDLLQTVDIYQKAMRSTKYAILFLSFTFLTFFFSEMLSKRRIHPMHYLLVGLALCIFYTLLLAFSEHIGFYWSYAISSLAVVAQITWYTKSFMSNTKYSLIVGTILALLYGFLFTVLQLEDLALLIGSIALFIVLTIAMMLSRKIQWGGQEEYN